MRIYSPWVPFENRGAALPADFLINGPEPVDGDEFASLNFANYFAQPANRSGLASMTGPQTLETMGWLPAREALPFTVKFENAAAASTHANQIEIVTQLDPDLEGKLLVRDGVYH